MFDVVINVNFWTSLVSVVKEYVPVYTKSDSINLKDNLNLSLES